MIKIHKKYVSFLISSENLVDDSVKDWEELLITVRACKRSQVEATQ